MRKSTANAIKTLLRMDSTVTSEESMAVIAAMRGKVSEPEPSQEMTVAEASAYLNISRTTLWRWCCAGKVASFRRGKRYLLKASEVAKLKGAA